VNPAERSAPAKYIGDNRCVVSEGRRIADNRYSPASRAQSVKCAIQQRLTGETEEGLIRPHPRAFASRDQKAHARQLSSFGHWLNTQKWDRALPFSDKAYQRPRLAGRLPCHTATIARYHPGTVCPFLALNSDAFSAIPRKCTRPSIACHGNGRASFQWSIARSRLTRSTGAHSYSSRGIPMSVAGIFSSSIGSNSVNAASSGRSQMQQLGQDLLSGNLSAAQSDFATLQQAFRQSSTSTSSPVTQAFQQLATDLKSGNLSAAQKDYTTIQQDLNTSKGHLHGHHHLKSSSNPDENSLLQDLTQLGQDISSANLSSSAQTAAQQAYVSMQKALDVGT
jgi:hypothetical protein